MRCTKSGVPLYSVGLVSLITCITFLVSSNSAVEVFNWFVDLTTTGLIMTYTIMLLIFLAWFRARQAQGLSNSDLYYVAPLQPYWAYFAFGFGCVALVFIGFDSFVPFKPQAFVTGYFGIPYTATLFFGYKYWKKTKLVDPKEADLVSGKEEVDRECAMWEEGGIDKNWRAALAEMPFWKRCWERMW